MYRDNSTDLLLVMHAQLIFILGWSCMILYFPLIFKYYVSSRVYFEKSGGVEQRNLGTIKLRCL